MDTEDAPEFLSELERNARKYKKLVLALRHTQEISREIEHSSTFTIAEILTRLLPHYVTAFEAQRGFVARRPAYHAQGQRFAVIATEPALSDIHEIASSARLEEMVNVGGSRILNTQTNNGPIPELSAFGARSAVLASFRALDHVYLVGLLDKVGAEQYPFLAGDRRVLESLLSLLAMGVRSVERRQRELRIIQEISEQIAASQGAMEGNDQIWRKIAQGAAEVSVTQVAGVYAYNAVQGRLEPRCTWDHERMAVIGGGAPLPLDSRSLNATAARSLRPIYLPDVLASEEIFLATAAETGVRSAYCTPLFSRGELVGTLYVGSKHLDGVGKPQREAIDRLAPHVAIALHNAQLLEQLQKVHEIDDDVIEIQQAIADVLQEEKQDQQLADVLARFFPPQSDFFVASYDPATGMVHLRIVHEKGVRIDNLAHHPHYRPRRIGERRGLLEYMFYRDLPLLDVPNFSEWEDAHEIEEGFRNDMQCCLIKTLKYGGQRTGWIGFRNFTRPESFSDRHRVLLERIADHIAIVQHNARLYEQRIRDLKAVSEFQTRITRLSRTEREEINSVAEEVRRTLRELGVHTGDFYIALYDESRNLLRVPICYEYDRALTKEEREQRPAYCTRPLEKRNGLVEWVLRHNQPVFAPNRAAIERWREQGVMDLPEAVCCWLGVPMRVRNRPVGVIALRSFMNENVFTELHVPLLQTIADQAAITVENARLFQNLYSQQNALLRTSRAIAAEGGDDRDSVLRIILEQAVRVTESHLGMLYLKRGEVLELHSIYPSSEEKRIRTSFATIPLSQPGIMTLAVREKRAVLETDVTNAKAYLDVSDGVTRSELAVVLFRGGKRTGDVIGVLNVEHKEAGGLNDHHRSLLISLAQLAVSAIQNAEKSADRRRLYTIAVMGAYSADVIHDVKQEISTIRWAVDRLRRRPDLPPDARTDLKEIDDAAARMRVPDISATERALWSADIQRNCSPLDAVIKEEVESFRQKIKKERQIDINIELNLDCNETCVSIHEEWLRRMIRHYLYNALKHLDLRKGNRHKPHITVRTSKKADKAIVLVEDNGRGVREEIRARLFSWEIDHGNEPPGRGLLLVRLIAEVHRGEAWLERSEPGKGACFAFSLPVAAEIG